MRKVPIIVALILLVCYCNLFGQNTDDESLVGIFQGEEYSNQVLGFKFKVPAKWYVPTKDQIKKYVEMGNKDFKVGDSKSSRYEKIEFVIAKKKIDSTENSVIGYSLIKQLNVSVTAKMIAEVTKSHFLKTSDVKLIKDISVERLGNRDFVTFEMGFHSFPKQRVRIYMVMSDVYLITFALTYWSDDELKVIMNSLNTIEFQSK